MSVFKVRGNNFKGACKQIDSVILLLQNFLANYPEPCVHLTCSSLPSTRQSCVSGN